MNTKSPPQAAIDLEATKWALRQVRRRQQNWLKFRWFSVCVGVAAFLGGLAMLAHEISDFAHTVGQAQTITGSELMLTSMHSFSVVETYILSMLGGFMVVRAIARWRGNPHDILLLSQIESQQAETNNPTAP